MYNLERITAAIKEMKINKKNLVKSRAFISYFQILILICAVFAFAFLLAPQEAKAVEEVPVPQVSYCCEKTTYGAWCQNEAQEKCDPKYQKTPTSCASTSFCKAGCCYDSMEGTCMMGTSQTVCKETGGTWADSAYCAIPQCEMGCCLLGTQASFITLTQCKGLSGFYGLETDFRKEITDNLECLEMAGAQEEGACVYDIDYQKTCTYTTKQGCQSIAKASEGTLTTGTTAASTAGTPISSEGTGTSTSTSDTSTPTFNRGTGAVITGFALKAGEKLTGNVTFHQGWLCSAEELGTNCAPTQITTCVEGRNEVYFTDSCGNIANIYDAARASDASYWNKKIAKENSCGFGASNANSAACGNCDYFSGSMCRQYVRGEDAKPTYGENVCRDLDCAKGTTLDNKARLHGESWCSSDKIKNSPGSRYFRHICVDNQEIVEPCADYRQEVCIDNKAEEKEEAVTFSEAACRVNRWQECASIYDEGECSNTDKRECKWIQDKWCSDEAINKFKANSAKLGVGGESEDEGIRGLLCCVPSESPGLKHWEKDSTQVCSLADTICIVTFKAGLFDKGLGDCTKNCDCLSESGTWAGKQKQKCTSLGDCGGKPNFVGAMGRGAGYKFQVMDMDKAKQAYASQQQSSSGSSGQAGTYQAQTFGSGNTGGSSGNIASTSKDVASTAESAKKVTDVVTGKAISGMVPYDPKLAGPIAQKFMSAQPTVVTPSSVTKGFSQGTPVLYRANQATGETFAGVVTKSEGGLSTINSGGVIYENVPSSQLDLATNLKPEQVADLQKQAGLDPSKLSQGTTPPSAGAGGWGLAGDALMSGLAWGGILALVGGIAGSLLGPENSNAGTAGALAGLAGGATFGVVYTYMSSTVGTFGTGTVGMAGLTTWGWIASIGLGAAVGFAVFALVYEEVNQQVVIFQCLPWQAPLKGENCEKCNEEKRTCTEYRCKSLGQACGIVNKGTEQEKCVWVNRNDVDSPGIKPWESVLTQEYKYTEVREIPPGADTPGKMKIAPKSGSGCIKAYTPIKFGISNNEPSQCAMDFNRTDYKKYHQDVFDMMNFDLDSGLFLYNHTIDLTLPGPEALNNESPLIKANGVYSWYIRCRDANGNVNVGEFNVQFCVEPGPDTTQSEIVGSTINDGQCVQFGINQTAADIYINEPANCKWSWEDRDYNIMENNMTCATSITEINNQGVYRCTTTLTGIKDRQENKFYIRCKDKPRAADKDRNVMTTSKVYTLKGSEPVFISSLKINGKENYTLIEGGVQPVHTVFDIWTQAGCDNGKSQCYFSDTQLDGSWILFENDFVGAVNTVHNQSIYLNGGTYAYYFKCIDAGGNMATTNATFTINIDKAAPKIVRALQDENKLKILTDEKSTCVYNTDDKIGCKYKYEDGLAMLYANSTVHIAEWNIDATYYMKCEDKTGGNRPFFDKCTFIVKPSEF